MCGKNIWRVQNNPKRRLNICVWQPRNWRGYLNPLQTAVCIANVRWTLRAAALSESTALSCGALNFVWHKLTDWRCKKDEGTKYEWSVAACPMGTAGKLWDKWHHRVRSGLRQCYTSGATIFVSNSEAWLVVRWCTGETFYLRHLFGGVLQCATWDCYGNVCEGCCLTPALPPTTLNALQVTPHGHFSLLQKRVRLFVALSLTFIACSRRIFAGRTMRHSASRSPSSCGSRTTIGTGKPRIRLATCIFNARRAVDRHRRTDLPPAARQCCYGGTTDVYMCITYTYIYM